VPMPVRLAVAGSEYVPAVRPARSNTPGLPVVPRFRPPVPIEPVPERATVPAEMVVKPGEIGDGSDFCETDGNLAHVHFFPHAPTIVVSNGASHQISARCQLLQIFCGWHLFGSA
jgi:hypothetical protein